MGTQDTQLNTLLTSAIEAHQQGRLAEAAALYEKLLKTNPQHPDAIHLSGLIAFQSNDFIKAKILIKRAITYDTSNALYHANLGRVYMAVGDLAAACDAWDLALTIETNVADVHSDLAGALLKLEKYKAAVEHADQALALQAHHPEALINKALAHNNLGNLERDQMHFEDAVSNYIQALKIAPNESDVYSNLGVAYQEMGKVDKAISCYQKAIELDPENAEAHRNLGMAHLQMGAFELGWKEYEWRWKTSHFAPLVRNWSKPQWLGQDEINQTLLVHCEQGFGDTLQFARYLSLVAKKVKKLIVEAPKELAELLSSIEGVDEVIVHGMPLNKFDLQIPMLSLPYVFQTTLETIPSTVPYLQICEKKVQKWSDRLAKKDNEVLVGLAWKGSKAHRRNTLRSLDLMSLQDLFGMDQRLRFVSLQKDGGASDIASHFWAGRILDLTEELKTFDDTAALVSNLDIVVTPDTAIAHLSGGLGVQSVLMLPSVSEWRWLQHRSDCPWYPNTKLIRQHEHGSWSAVVAKVKNILLKTVKYK
ncbi:MAG: tetratricopeptide repeat protein [Rhodospirillales bacterium]